MEMYTQSAHGAVTLACTPVQAQQRGLVDGSGFGPMADARPSAVAVDASAPPSRGAPV